MLNAKKLGLAGGIVWALFCFFFVAFILLTGYGEGFINFMLSSFIKGYKLNWLGSLGALIGGFIDGFIFFYLLGFIYNIFSKKKPVEQNNQSLYD
jgi:hypothetical protein